MMTVGELRELLKQFRKEDVVTVWVQDAGTSLHAPVLDASRNGKAIQLNVDVRPVRERKTS